MGHEGEAKPAILLPMEQVCYTEGLGCTGTYNVLLCVQHGQGFATYTALTPTDTISLTTIMSRCSRTTWAQKRNKKKPHQAMDSEASLTNRSKSWSLLTAVPRLCLRSTERENGLNAKTGTRTSTTARKLKDQRNARLSGTTAFL